MAPSQYTEWRLTLINARTGAHIDDDSGVANVLTAGSPVEATIYSDEQGTAASNPLTFSNGSVRFYTLSSVTTVDVSVLTENSQACFLKCLTPSEQKVLINPDQLKQCAVIPFAASDNTETDTGFTLNLSGTNDILVEDVALNVVTVDAGETIDVGTNGTTTDDPNGLIAAALVSAAGYVELAGQITNGSNIDYVGANYLGAQLATVIAGADAVATVGGTTRLKTGILTAETDCNITYTGSAGSDTAAGYIYLMYTILP